jgi:hypothetical protein
MSFVIMDRQTKSSRTQWTRAYRRIAVVEIDDDYFAVERMKAAIFAPGLRHAPSVDEPKYIKKGTKGLRQIVRTWEHLNKGLTARSAYYRAMAEAVALCRELNAAEAHQEWTAGGERFLRDF